MIKNYNMNLCSNTPIASFTGCSGFPNTNTILTVEEGQYKIGGEIKSENGEVFRITDISNSIITIQRMNRDAGSW